MSMIQGGLGFSGASLPFAFDSQASQDLMVASSSAAWGRLAKGANNSLLGINGSGNVAYTSTPTLAGITVTQQATGTTPVAFNGIASATVPAIIETQAAGSTAPLRRMVANGSYRGLAGIVSLILGSSTLAGFGIEDSSGQIYATIINSGALEIWGRSSAGTFVATDVLQSRSTTETVDYRRRALKVHTAFAGSEAKRTTAAVQTTNDTVTSLFTFTLVDNTLYSFEATVIGRDAAGAERAYYVRAVRAHRQGGGATLGTVQTLVTDESDAAWDCTWDVSSNDVRLRVTGKAATTINWVCTVDYQAVSGSAA